MAYSNSPLATYTRISPNRNSPRNHSIDRITIHCIVGQWTAKQGCDYFANTTRGASCNYVVGKDGSIGLCVEERDRSWCSSSRENDNRAITIETASDTSHPYAVTDAALNALIELCTDICRRNGKRKLLWLGNKTDALAYTPAADEMVMTVHRWFKNKDCPGQYLLDRQPLIANSVTSRLADGGSEDLTETDAIIWHYMFGKIGNAYGVAGLMGNLYAESNLKPNNLQNSYETSLGYTDTTYTDAVDSGAYSESSFVNDRAGYGLAQWTYPSRKQGLYDMYKAGDYPSIGDIHLALDYLWQELGTLFPGVLSVLQTATSVREASDKVLHDFESPADQSESVEAKREEFGIYYYNKFAGSTGTGGDDHHRGMTQLSKLLLFAMALDT